MSVLDNCDFYSSQPDLADWVFLIGGKPPKFDSSECFLEEHPGLIGNDLEVDILPDVFFQLVVAM